MKKFYVRNHEDRFFRNEAPIFYCTDMLTLFSGGFEDWSED